MHLRGDGNILKNKKFNIDINRDFTLDKYRNLCETVLSLGYSPLTVKDYLYGNYDEEKFVIFRHDVDKWPENALEMALLESDLGIRSTYYFRYVNNVFSPSIIRQIHDYGHEIGYHYETLVKANGDTKSALKIFLKELSIFREICDVETICMHGNSLSKWDNRDLWKSYSFQDYEIIGEAYLSINFGKVLYLSDSGGSWNNSKIRIKDRVSSDSLKTTMKTKNTDDIIDVLSNTHIKQIYVLTHPDRWNNSFSKWSYEYAWKRCRNFGKACYRTCYISPKN